MKKFISVLLAVVLCISACSVVSFAADPSNAEVVVKGEAVTASRGDEITFSINLEKNTGLTQLDFMVDYPSDMLEIKTSYNAESGEDVACVDKALFYTTIADNASGPQTPYQNPYYVGWAYSTTKNNYTGTGVIVTFHFKVKADAPITTKEIKILMKDCADSSLVKRTTAAVNGSITVECKNHEAGTPVVTVPATCETAGTTVTNCKHCGAVMSTDTTKPAKLGHLMDNGTVTTEPTCTEKGVKTYKCTRSGCTHTETEELSALGHLMDNGTVTTEPTCTKKGVKTYKCTHTGCTHTTTEEVAALKHNWVEKSTTAAKCGEPGEVVYECTRCFETYSEPVAALNHLWDDGTITTEPTCTEKGVKTYKCTRTGCTHTTTEEIAALGHSLDKGTVTTEPTCTEKGVKTYKCTRTGCTHTTTEEIAALGHSLDKGTVTTEPTCTEKGVKTYKCTRTGCTHTATEEVEALGHAWDDGTVLEPSTLTEMGKIEFACTRTGCTETKIEDIAKLVTILNSESNSVAVVQISVDDDNAFSGTTKLLVLNNNSLSGSISGKSVIAGYAMSLTDNGIAVDADKTVSVKLKIDSQMVLAFKNLGIAVNGTFVDAVEEDGYLTFTAKVSDLASVAVVGTAVANNGSESSGNNADNGSNSDSKSPTTGESDAIAFAIVFMAVAASAVVVCKKKVRV